MSEINSGECGTSEVSETTSEATENQMDSKFSDELDQTYASYMEDKNIHSPEQEESEQPPESKETPEQKESEEKEKDSEDLDTALDKKYNEYLSEGTRNTDAADSEQHRGELSETDRAALKEETGWSDEVVNHIDTAEQAEIYQNAQLHQETINGRECLVKEIDLDYVDEKTGMTNRELMAKGRSPYDAKTGEKIELHHMGQQYDAPFAELTENSEHGNGNHSILHPKTENSWRNNEELEAQYRKEKREYWKTRSEE